MKPSLASRRTFAENCASFVSGMATAAMLLLVVYGIWLAVGQVASLQALSIYTD